MEGQRGPLKLPGVLSLHESSYSILWRHTEELPAKLQAPRSTYSTSAAVNVDGACITVLWCWAMTTERWPPPPKYKLQKSVSQGLRQTPERDLNRSWKYIRNELTCWLTGTRISSHNWLLQAYSRDHSCPRHLFGADSLPLVKLSCLYDRELDRAPGAVYG